VIAQALMPLFGFLGCRIIWYFVRHHDPAFDLFLEAASVMSTIKRATGTLLCARGVFNQGRLSCGMRLARDGLVTLAWVLRDRFGVYEASPSHGVVLDPSHYSIGAIFGNGSGGAGTDLDGWWKGKKFPLVLPYLRPLCRPLRLISCPVQGIQIGTDEFPQQNG